MSAVIYWVVESLVRYRYFQFVVKANGSLTEQIPEVDLSLNIIKTYFINSKLIANIMKEMDVQMARYDENIFHFHFRIDQVMGQLKFRFINEHELDIYAVYFKTVAIARILKVDDRMTLKFLIQITNYIKLTIILVRKLLKSLILNLIII